MALPNLKDILELLIPMIISSLGKGLKQSSSILPGIHPKVPGIAHEWLKPRHRVTGDRRYRQIIMNLFLALLLCPLNTLAAEQQSNQSFSVLSYNVFLRSPAWVFFQDNHNWRTDYISSKLRGFDAVVLQEAFSNRHRNQIIDALSQEYPYQSDILGVDEFLNYNGGVTILSRWPILTQSQTEFGSCDGSDCWVKKGVVYVSIDKQGSRYHLFGLHLQAQVEYAEARLAQIPEIRDFVDSQNIPEDEPLLIAGDFNINFFSNNQDREFETVVETLNVQFNESQPQATYASATNSLLEDEVSERLDYVFYSRGHLLPIHSSNEVIYIREDASDLSDHHGVVGRFEFRRAK